jgi:hypothetical protein
MRSLSFIALSLVMVLSLFSCKSASPTDPITYNDYVNPETCDYWVSFSPSEEFPGQYRAICNSKYWNYHPYTLLFNGSQAFLGDGHSGLVSATPGKTYSGVLMVGETPYPFTIQIANNFSNVSCDNNAETPHLTWSVPASSMHQHIGGTWNTEDGEGSMRLLLPSNMRDFTFPYSPYTSVGIFITNSFYSSSNNFGVYSSNSESIQFDLESRM